MFGKPMLRRFRHSGQFVAGAAGKKVQRRPAPVPALVLSSLRPYFARFPPAFGPVPRPTISAEGGVVRP